MYGAVAIAFPVGGRDARSDLQAGLGCRCLCFESASSSGRPPADDEASLEADVGHISAPSWAHIGFQSLKPLMAWYQTMSSACAFSDDLVSLRGECAWCCDHELMRRVSGAPDFANQVHVRYYRLVDSQALVGNVSPLLQEARALGESICFWPGKDAWDAQQKIHKRRLGTTRTSLLRFSLVSSVVVLCRWLCLFFSKRRQ